MGSVVIDQQFSQESEQSRFSGGVRNRRMSVVLPSDINEDSLVTFMAKHAAFVRNEHMAEVKWIIRGLSRLMGAEMLSNQRRFAI